LVGLSEPVAGLCQLEVEPTAGYVSRPTGVQVVIEAGCVVSCVSRLVPDPPAYAVGSAVKWFSAVSRGKFADLRFGGSSKIAEDVVAGLHATYRNG
jgi:hypothetical protein